MSLLLGHRGRIGVYITGWISKIWRRTYTVPTQANVPSFYSTISTRETWVVISVEGSSRWNWFISANIEGKWLITNGYADVNVPGNSQKATLQFSPDADPYEYVGVEIGEDGAATASVESPREGVPTYSLQGQLYADDKGLSLILTDGCTILGLAYGLRSQEPNLA